MHDISGARIVLSRGREHCAEPLDLLNEASDAFELRQIQTLRNFSDSENDFIDESELSAQRLALGQLTGKRIRVKSVANLKKFDTRYRINNLNTVLY